MVDEGFVVEEVEDVESKRPDSFDWMLLLFEVVVLGGWLKLNAVVPILVVILRVVPMNVVCVFLRNKS